MKSSQSNPHVKKKDEQVVTKILITGAAGFIGYHCIRHLIQQGFQIVGVDNMNNYYDPELKKGRLNLLQELDGFTFQEGDVANYGFIKGCVDDNPEVEIILHLAAQAGVRYSLENPFAYGHSNLTGQLSMLELCRYMKETGRLKHFIYASSSSVYGGNKDYPFCVEDRVDNPVSLYAATKRSGELLAQSYSNLYAIPSTGLRFFTVYGPWGRPDMAYYSFTKSLFEGETIHIFNNGDMGRDFTYIDDIVRGIEACLSKAPAADEEGTVHGAPHRIFNLGNNKPERLMDFVKILENLTGKKADIELQPMQPGDVKETYANIDLSQKILGFQPETSLEEGLPKFVEWYTDFTNKSRN